VRDQPGDQEVQRRASALAEHRVERTLDRPPRHEQRERLVLVRRPGRQLDEQERRDGGSAGRDAEGEGAAAELGHGRKA
jgi:hypothetical protein